MLSSGDRLKSKKLIYLVRKKGSVYKTPFFRVFFLKSYQGGFKSVVVVSKKHSKSAVERNFIRRRVNGALQKKKYELKKMGMELPVNLYVIFPCKSVKYILFKKLYKEIEKMIEVTRVNNNRLNNLNSMIKMNKI